MEGRGDRCAGNLTGQIGKAASWETLYSRDVMLIHNILEVPLESVVPALSSLNDTESAPMLAPSVQRDQ